MQVPKKKLLAWVSREDDMYDAGSTASEIGAMSVRKERRVLWARTAYQ